MTLKVGDKVRVGKKYGNVVPEGSVGVVTNAYGWDAVDVRVEGDRPDDGSGLGWHYYAREVEKIEEPTPKFKVGDRVLDRAYSKEVVTVTSTNANPTWPIQARYPDGGLGLWKESELEKVESVPFKLERGDKVINRKTGREGIVQGWADGLFVTDAQRPRSQHVPASALEEYEEHHPGTYDLIKKDAPW